MNSVITHGALALAMSLVLTGCEAEQADTQETADPAPQQAPRSSGETSPAASPAGEADASEPSPALASHDLARIDACELLSATEIQAVVDTEAELRKLSPCQGERQCRYRWAKPNAEQLRSEIVKKIADGNFGEDPFNDFHLLHPEFSIEITLTDAKASGDDFVPPATPATVPEEVESTGDGEMQDEAQDDSRQHDGQRTSLAQTVPDLGDAAYWQPGSIDELHVRVGDQRIILAVFASEDPERNAEIARRLATQALQPGTTTAAR